jgi:site-specific DNA recombinase
LVSVVVRLAERGIATVTGKRRWDPATVRGILLNPAYTGTAKYGKTRLVQRTEGRRPKRGDPPRPRQEKVTRATLPEEQESIPVPALVSGDLFAAVAQRLEENRRRHREQKQGSEFLLGGLLVCQRCGSAYCGRRHRQGKRCYVYYRCIGTDRYRHAGEPICANRGVSGTALEAVVWSDVCSLLQDPGRLHRELERRLQRSSPEEADAPHRLESIAKLKRRLGRLVDAYENGWLEKDEFQLRIGRVKERLAREQEAYAQSLKDATSEQELRLIVGQFETFAQQIASGLKHADTAAKRKLLRLLIKQIEIDDVDLRIVYKVQPHPFVLSPNRGILQDCLKCR